MVYGVCTEIPRGKLCRSIVMLLILLYCLLIQLEISWVMGSATNYTSCATEDIGKSLRSISFFLISAPGQTPVSMHCMALASQPARRISGLSFVAHGINQDWWMTCVSFEWTPRSKCFSQLKEVEEPKLRLPCTSCQYFRRASFNIVVQKKL